MLSRHLVHSSAIEGLDQTLYKGSESPAEADNKKATKSYFLRQCARNRRLARRLACSKMWHTENEWPWECFMLREVCVCVRMCWQNWLCSQFCPVSVAVLLLTADWIGFIWTVCALYFSVTAPPSRKTLSILTGEICGCARLLRCVEKRNIQHYHMASRKHCVCWYSDSHHHSEWLNHPFS